MKKIFWLIAISTIIANASLAQSEKDVITEKITVSGVCGQCKKRIEDAAYIKGVKRAEWDKQSKELTITYRSSKVDLKKIEESISKTGHDAGNTKRDEQAYEKLPSCCAYDDGHDH